MPEDTFLAVPIAAVQDNWLETIFFPAADAALAVSGPVLLPVDAGQEGDYLLNVLARRCVDRGLTVRDWLVDAADPFRFWASFTGSAEESGWLPTSENEVWLVYNGELIPANAVLTHFRELDYLTRASGSRTIIPLYRSQLTLFDGVSNATRLVVPSLAETDQGRLETLTRTLVRSRVPGFADPASAIHMEALVQRLVGAKPISRPQLEAWIEFFACQENPATVPFDHGPPFSTDPTHVPPPIPTRRDLQDRFITACKRLSAIGVEFEKSIGEPLVFPHQTLKDPFTSPEPQDWFFGLISYISCIVFDAGKFRLDILAKYKFNAATGDFEGEPASPLLKNLRPMRTRFQHAVQIIGNERNNATLSAVENWLITHSDGCTPGPPQYRRLVVALIDEWLAFVDGIVAVVTNLPNAASKQTVLNDLALAARNIEQGELLEMIDRAAALVNLQIDAEAFRKKYENDLKSELTKSVLVGRELKDFAGRWVETKVISETRKCPVDGEWLRNHGISPGPELGDWRKRFHAEWDNIPLGTTNDSFVENAAARIKVYLQTKETKQ